MKRAAFALFALAFSTPAFAQVAPCLPLIDMLAKWKTEFDEEIVGAGTFTNSDRGVIVTAAPSGSFSLWLSRPDGMVCLGYTGDNWRPKPQSRKGT